MIKNIDVIMVDASLLVRIAKVQDKSKVSRKGPHKSPNYSYEFTIH
jgi:hypothetical protein